MIGVVVVALTGETAEVRHGGAVIVGGGDFQLIHLAKQDLAFGVKDHSSNHFVEGVHTGFGVVAAGALTTHAVHAQTDVSFSSFGHDGSGFHFFFGFSHIGELFGIQRVVHGVDDAVAGVGGLGHNVHFGAVLFHDLGDNAIHSHGHHGGRVGSSFNFHRDDVVAFLDDGDGHKAHKAVSLTGQFFGHGGNGKQHCDAEYQSKNLAHGGFLLHNINILSDAVVTSV